ncbi:MAG: hypothetical protein JRH01_14965 [Deltaproteobacteria bacterium]|nr:hypothetical protein [Deltaproteobacteria bacterium]MBW2395520.1 hypothetical protein [Deltaproteobacteria bacterium]
MTALWSGLFVAIALSPSLVETARHLMAEPWKSSALVVPLLLVALARAEGKPGGPLRRPALGWIVLAVGIELLAAGAGLLRWSRLSLGIAGFGWLRATSWTKPTSAYLAFLAVPLPSFASRLTSPMLERTWSRLAASVLPNVDARNFPLPLHYGDGGLHLLVLGAALGAYAGLRHAESTARCFGLAAIGALALMLLQPLAVILAAGLAETVGPGFARGFLDLALPWTAGLAVIFSVERQASRSRSTREPA